MTKIDHNQQKLRKTNPSKSKVFHSKYPIEKILSGHFYSQTSEDKQTKKICLRKSGWPKKSPPGRQGIHFFPNFQKIHTIQVFKGTKEISGRLKSTKQIGLLCCQPLITSFEWRSPRIRSYFNSYPLSPPKHLNNNNRTSDVRV